MKGGSTHPSPEVAATNNNLAPGQGEGDALAVTVLKRSLFMLVVYVLCLFPGWL